MATFLKVLIMVLVTGSAHAATPSFDKLVLAGYTKKSDGGWIGKKNKTNVVTTTVMQNAWFNLTSAEAPKYVHKQEEVRGVINFFAGITDWVAVKHEYKKEGERVTLSMEGEFKHAGKTDYFVEKQVFIKPNIYQIKMISPDRHEVVGEAANKVFESALAALR